MRVNGQVVAFASETRVDTQSALAKQKSGERVGR